VIIEKEVLTSFVDVSQWELLPSINRLLVCGVDSERGICNSPLPLHLVSRTLFSDNTVDFFQLQLPSGTMGIGYQSVWVWVRVKEHGAPEMVDPKGFELCSP